MKEAEWLEMTVYGSNAAICLERLAGLLERVCINTPSLEVQGNLYFKNARWTWRGRWRPTGVPC
jgi:hypothetical protein